MTRIFFMNTFEIYKTNQLKTYNYTINPFHINKTQTMLNGLSNKSRACLPMSPRAPFSKLRKRVVLCFSRL